mmetsp:Transcript_3318/g.4262  ORF Transcript_3318/g.4262 Transcript_3318/m.4262 type:complete len:419 (+) Transcript_3318:163-1419(+)
MFRFLSLACAISACLAFHPSSTCGSVKVLFDIRGRPHSQRKVTSTQHTITKNSEEISSNPRTVLAKFLNRSKTPGPRNEGWKSSRLNAHNATPHDQITFRTRKGEYLSIPQAERYTTRDWFHNLSTIPSSYTLQRIRQPIFLTMVWTLIVHTTRHFLGFPGLSPKAHTFVSSALGLLLVFRTNAAYNRFWEGRQIWQKILNESRSVARMITLYKDEIGKSNRKRLTNLICAFPIILQEHLKGVRQPHRTEYFLDSDDFCDLGRASNRPLCLVNKMAKVVKSVKYTEDYTSRERLAMLSIINKLSDHVGACERLVQTPVPLAYARHTSRFLSIWILTLPFVLDDVGFFVVPAMGLIAWALFGIQEIGLLIEDPFKRALKLDVIIDTIYADVIQTMGSQDILPIYQSTPFFANFELNSPK